jgi:hypothetical protein
MRPTARRQEWGTGECVDAFIVKDRRLTMRKKMLKFSMRQKVCADKV